MKKSIIILLLLVLCSLSSLFLYSKAEQSSSNPQLISEALKKKDTSTLIKELALKIKNEVEIDEASYPGLIKEVENYAAACKNPAESAILHSLIADMYSSFESRNSWVYRQRTPITGYIPEDINEWTSNLFKDKIAEEYRLSLQSPELLQQTPINNYKDILQVGKDEQLRPSLYDYLIYRILEREPSDELYRELIAYKRKANSPKALMLAELDYLNYKENELRYTESNSHFITSLDSLAEVYKSYDFAAEIWISKIEMMSNNKYNVDHPDIDLNNEEILRLSEETIEKYPSYERISILKNKIALMKKAELYISLPSVAYQGKELMLNINYQNVSSINIKVYETGLDSEKIRSDHRSYERIKEEDKTNRKLIRQTNIALHKAEFYKRIDTTFQVSSLDKKGIYEYEITVPGTQIKTQHFVYVTKISSVSRLLPSGDAEILVTDFQSGKPIDKATVYFYNQSQNKLICTDSLITDDDGIAKLTYKENTRFFRAAYKDDTFSPLAPIYLGKQFLHQPEQNPAVSLFTDRGLYRPGQNVYFKGIVSENNKEQAQVLANRVIKVYLRDANHSEVATREFTTNEFGSFNGEFILPKQTLNGDFTLSTENTTISFRVEEYKRPSFKIEIDPLKEEFAFGDTIGISGKAQTFSGVALQEGIVRYSVIYTPFRFYSFFPDFGGDQLLAGEARLNEDGAFHFNFVPERREQAGLYNDYASYKVIAFLTDSKGESQETSSFFTVGASSIVLTTNLKEKEIKEKLLVEISARTLNGEKTQAEGSYSILPLTEKRDIITGKIERKPGEIIAKGHFSTATPLPSNLFSTLSSGAYRIKLEASDAKGRPVSVEQEVILYSEKDKRPPVFSDTWLTESDRYCLPGEEILFNFGTSHKKAYVLYELFSQGKNIMRKRIELSDENKKLSLTFEESYGEGVTASFTFVKEGKLYTNQFRIYKKMPDKTLRIKTESFRDKLMPGDQESWKLKIIDADSLPATAEVLASMYDASLDKIMPFGWNLTSGYRSYLYIPSFRNNPAYTLNMSYGIENVDMIDVPQFEYSRIEWEDALLTNSIFAYSGSTSSLKMRSATAAPMADMAIEEVAVANDAASGVQEGTPTGKESDVSPRRNFNETAFFFPVLRTDKEGAFTINFTLPESNTTWKFQALAHTKDMKYGQLTKEVVSSKPLMVVPNIPRFLRKGDEVNIRAQVINQSEETLSGRVRLELFDPYTEQAIVCLSKSQQPFSLEGGGQAVVNWTVPVPTDNELVGIRIVADTETVSDGEQHVLPVLSNEILITESHPFYLTTTGDNKINLPKYIKANRRPYMQTLEISANPIWYAVQALPTLTRPENNSASAWFASYYSNVLASAIIQANPRIRTMISNWASTGNSATTLLSNLEKNEELKNILLEETPWILEASNETEQMQMLHVLFDLNRAASQREESLQELIRMQREDGAWGWFRGFGADRHITTLILQGMADLVRLNAIEYGQQEKEMQMKALKYLDDKIQEDYAWITKQNKNLKNTTPSEQQMDYLLMRSNYRDIPEAKEVREAIRFYTNQAEKQWEKLSVRMKVQTALLLHRNGNKEKAKTILGWFQRTATRSEEQGIFWANNRRNGFSSVSPVETHTLLLSAFEEIQMENMDVDRMKQWLLNQKRTQNWGTTPATLNAIYALLLKGKDWLGEENKYTVHWGNQTIESESGLSGIGYNKVTKTATDTNTAVSINIRKEGSAPAWGAFYEQYFTSADQVDKLNGDLSVEKKVFVEKSSEKGPQLVALKEGETLRVGDKAVIRLTIRVKQEMTYVHLKDMRAGCFEPVEQVSGIHYSERTSYYKTGKDASEHFFFDRLPQGTYVIEHRVYAVRSGEYAFGPAEIQCLYAPEFISRSDGSCLIIKD